MNVSDAKVLLELPIDFNKELLRLQYHTHFIETLRQKSASLTVEDGNLLDEKLKRINKAFSVIDGSIIVNESELQFDFRFEKFEKKIKIAKSHRSNDDFVDHIDNLIHQDRYGLALSLLEIGIDLSLKENSKVSLHSVDKAINTIGKVIVELGLVNQGIRYQNFKSGNFEKALAYHNVGEYKLAAHYFALELKSKESDIPADNICRRISICYFLLNDYENSIKIIEEVLPKLIPKKNIFEESCESKVFATAIMVSMYKLNKVSRKNFDKIRVRLKYPLCNKYLQGCYGKIEKALVVIENFEKDNKAYDEFLNKLKPKSFIKESVDLQYTLNELQENYYDLFEQPMNKSLLYNPK